VRLRFAPLGNHDRAAFSCGEKSVDDFLKRYAAQYRLRNIGVPFVAVDADGDPRRILGYYFMVPHEFRGTELPDTLRRGARVGNLSAVPGALLAQLGVSKEFAGQGIGVSLVSHALKRLLSIATEWGCVAIVTDPINARAPRLYMERFDFTPIFDDSPRLILSIRTLATGLLAATERNRRQ